MKGILPLGLISFTLLVAPAPAFAPPTSKPPAGRHALLVGCTRYPNLPEPWWLKGPANDVVLMRQLLTTQFDFPAKNIVTLAEKAGGEKLLPTRANIQREFDRLAKVAKPGDQIVIFLAGHGSQQPEANPDDPENSKPDGMDETFLPRDVGLWDGDKGPVAKAIVCKELRDWLKTIRAKGASLWVIVDACHSATMVRGTEVPREVPPDKLGIPKGEIKKAAERARKRAEKKRGGPATPNESALDLGLVPDLAAVYACLATEATWDWPLPMNDPNPKKHGLFTYTLCQVLTEAQRAKKPLTYTELVQAIRNQYAAMGVPDLPTPLVEGKDRFREVLGLKEWPHRSEIILRRDKDAGWQVNAGALHGLTPGSILAVYPPAGRAGADQVQGHVRVKELRPLEARVEPCAYAPAKMRARQDLPLGGRCQAVNVDFGPLRLRLAVEGAPKQDTRGAEFQRLGEKLRDLGKAPDSLIEVVKDHKAADWLVRLEEGRVALVPAGGWSRTAAAQETASGLSSRLDAGTLPWLKDSLSRVARARNLLTVAGKVGKGWAESPVKVEIELLRFRDVQDREGRPVALPGGGLVLKPGDIWGFRMRNPHPFEVDVTLLLIDSGYGIKAYFPAPGVVGDNRLPAKGEGGEIRWVRTPRRRVLDQAGRYHVVAIAVKAQGAPVDFSALEQPTAEKFREVPRGEAARKTALARVLEKALYGQGRRDPPAKAELGDYAMHLFSWRTLGKPPAK
jgi:Caspase domain